MGSSVGWNSLLIELFWLQERLNRHFRAETDLHFQCGEKMPNPGYLFFETTRKKLT